MIILLFALCGALWNRIRGHGIKFGKIANDVAFGLLASFIVQEWWMLPVAAFFMLLGRSMGWGDYIGALGGWRKTDLEEDEFIDALIRPFYNQPRLWGFMGMTLRGAFWGFCLFLIPGIGPIAMTAGTTMGVCYFLTFEVCKLLKVTHWENTGWEWSEVIFGAVLWAAALGSLYYHV